LAGRPVALPSGGRGGAPPKVHAIRAPGEAGERTLGGPAAGPLSAGGSGGLRGGFTALTWRSGGGQSRTAPDRPPVAPGGAGRGGWDFHLAAAPPAGGLASFAPRGYRRPALILGGLGGCLPRRIR